MTAEQAVLIPEQEMEGKYVPDFPVQSLAHDPGIRTVNLKDPTFRKLVESVARRGVIKPVLLALLPSGDYEVIDGRRRVRAAMEAGREGIKAIVSHTEGPVPAALGLHLHVTRSANVAAEVQQIRQLQQMGHSDTAIARATGMALPTIRKRALLNQLPEPLAVALEDGRISASVAEATAKCPAADRETLANQFIATGRLTLGMVEDTRRAAATMVATTLPGDLFGGPDLPIDQDEEPYALLVGLPVLHSDAPEDIARFVEDCLRRAGLSTMLTSDPASVVGKTVATRLGEGALAITAGRQGGVDTIILVR
jgi:ParB/RepB/Spo0J family partition protein